MSFFYYTIDSKEKTITIDFVIVTQGHWLTLLSSGKSNVAQAYGSYLGNRFCFLDSAYVQAEDVIEEGEIDEWVSIAEDNEEDDSSADNDAQHTQAQTQTAQGIINEFAMKLRDRDVSDDEIDNFADGILSLTQIEGAQKNRKVSMPFKESLWKECPGYVVDDEKMKYSVSVMNPRIVTKINGSDWYCTIIGNTPLPHNKLVSWNIKILKSNYDR